MRRRHPLPKLWLMTDERAAPSLEAALQRLPRGGGVVFRHHATLQPERMALFARVKRIARARGLPIVLAGSADAAARAGADGVHGHRGRRRAGLIRTASVHDLRELRRARTDLIFLSPLFATRSHPGAPTLGIARFAGLARRARVPVIALGGMRPARWTAARAAGAYGWAAIDAWSQPTPRSRVG